MSDKFLVNFSIGTEKISEGVLKFFALGLVSGKELWPSQLSEFGLLSSGFGGLTATSNHFVSVVPVWKVFISYTKETQKNFTSVFVQFSKRDSFKKVVFPWADDIGLAHQRRCERFHFAGRFHIMNNAEAKKELATDSPTRKYMQNLYGLPVSLKAKLVLSVSTEEDVALLALEDKLIGRSARDAAVSQVIRRSRGRKFRGLNGKNGPKL